MTEEFTTEFFWQKCQKKYRTGSGTHPTSENGKLAAFASGRPAFQQHVKRTEGSDTTPRLAHSESTERRVYKPQLRQKRKDHAAQRGRGASEQRHA